ncbi:MAG: hypothetical protein LBG90_07265, partial [Spirochaetaceae bacterium]|nr:hypothetical protein [Spirochaetaceae bacterium]
MQRFKFRFSVYNKTPFFQSNGKFRLAIAEKPFHPLKTKHPIHKYPVNIRAWKPRVHGKTWRSAKI